MQGKSTANAVRLIFSVTGAVLLLFSTGCWSHNERIVGTWRIDTKASKLMLFAASTQPSELDARMEARTKAEIGGKEFVFGSPKEGALPGFQGMYLVQRNGEPTDEFGAWKRLTPVTKKEPPSIAYLMFEGTVNGPFLAQGELVVTGNIARWRPKVGDMGGMTLVMVRK